MARRCSFTVRFLTSRLPSLGSAAVLIATLCASASFAEDWPQHGLNAGETRFSPLQSINENNVADLGLLWSADMGSKRGLEATPLMVNGVLYVSSTWSVVYAIDARTGKQRWRYDPKVSREKTASKACCDVVNRGVAVHDARVYLGTLDGRLIAIDARNGKPVWETFTVDPDASYTITGAPRVVKGKVLIGNGGGEYGVRGYVSAYDAVTGELAWRFYTVPGDPSKPFEHPELEVAAKTWTGEWWKVGGGGTVWDSMSYDAELDLVYVGTGNSSPWSRPARSPEGGDNLFVSTILALRPDTGKLVWHYQVTPGDRFDYTATQHMILADLDINGEQRKVLMQAPKNGFFYVLDRATGELISADAYAKVTWAKGIGPDGRPIPADDVDPSKTVAEIWPSTKGGHNWQPMSYHPGTGLVYVPAIENVTFYKEDPAFTFKEGVWNLGYDVTAPAPPRPVSGHLLAWDPVKRKEAWRVEHSGAWNGGTLATAGNIVFQGLGTKSFAAFHAGDGKKLWERSVPSGIIGSPITYAIDGKQYVAVLSGWGGGFALNMGKWAAATGNKLGTPGRLLVFALGAQGKMPVDDIKEKPVPEIDAEIDPALAKKGALAFHTYCFMCHGPRAVGGGTVPDLRKSAEAMYGLLPQVLLNGILARRGMPSFADHLDSEDVAAIRAYLLMERAGMLAEKAKTQ